MPYKIEEEGDVCKVVNEETEEVVATHEPPDARGKAERQVRLLHEAEAEMDGEHGD